MIKKTKKYLYLYIDVICTDFVLQNIKKPKFICLKKYVKPQFVNKKNIRFIFIIFIL